MVRMHQVQTTQIVPHSKLGPRQTYPVTNAKTLKTTFELVDILKHHDQIKGAA